MMGANNLIVRSEDEAISAIENALLGKLPEQFNVTFKKWPLLEIRFKGEGYNSTITSSIAEAIVELQASINRSYCLAVYGENKANKLTDKEKSALQFKAKIENGSSLINIDLSNAVNSLCSELAGKMDSTSIILVALTLGVLYTGSSMYKAYLKSKTEEKEIEENEKTKIAMTQEETKRQAILAQALNKNPILFPMSENINIARNQFLRSAEDAKTMSMNGVEINNKTAKAAVTSKRESAKEIQANGTFHVLAVDFRSSDSVKLSLQRLQDGKTFTASFKDDSLDKEQITILQEAEWERKRVYLQINATELRGEITTATVISVQRQPD